jgi:hypothetical protein
METNHERLKWFLVSLAALALVINYCFYQNTSFGYSIPHQRPVILPATQPPVGIDNAAAAREAEAAASRMAAEEAEASQRAIREAAEKHAAFLARYLNTGFSRKAGEEMIGLSVASDDGQSGRMLKNALVGHLQKDGVQILPDFLKTDFVSDGLFDDAFGGSPEVARKLELATVLDAFVLVRVSVTFSKNPDLLNVITATMNVEIVLTPISPNIENHSWSFTAAGAGFKREDARALALDRLLKQIERDTKMSLN